MHIREMKGTAPNLYAIISMTSSSCNAREGEGYSIVTWTVPLTDRCTVGPLRVQLLGEQVQGEGKGGEGGELEMDF